MVTVLWLSGPASLIASEGGHLELHVEFILHLLLSQPETKFTPPPPFACSVRFRGASFPFSHAKIQWLKYK